MASYGDIHRRFLQSFVYHPAQTEEEVMEAYRLACEEQGVFQMYCLNKFIETINNTIRRHTTLEIKTAVCELTNKKYYIATNTAYLKWTKTTSLYNKKEQTIFKNIVDDLVMSENGNISSIACLNSNAEMKMSKSEKSEIIAKFVKDGWFAEKKGHLFMGVRGAVELEPYIMQTYQDIISFCTLCRQLIFWGQHCGGCSDITHFHCLRRFFESSSKPPACPACNTRWSNWDDHYLSVMDDESD